MGIIDRLGLMKVGPESAGSLIRARPAMGLAGMIQRLPMRPSSWVISIPIIFWAGRCFSRIDLARKTMKEKLADPLGISVEAAAMGINRIVTENMATATRIHISEKGKDPRKYDLIAFGGAGPIHAFRIAEIMKLKRIICPAAAGAASALGLLVAPLAVDLVRSYMARLDRTDWNRVRRIFAEMEEEATDNLMAAGVDRKEIYWERTADMRYAGQFYEIPSPVPSGSLGPEMVPKMVEDFYQAYDRTFGRHLTDSPIQVLTWRLRASCVSPRLKIHYSGKRSAAEASGIKGQRKAYFPDPGDFVETPVYDRYSLAPGSSFQGPAIIEERECTTVVGFHSRFYIDENFNLIVERD